MILLTVSYTLKSQYLLNRDWNQEIIVYEGGGGVVQKRRHSIVLLAVKKTPQEIERLNRVVTNNLFICLLHYL